MSDLTLGPVIGKLIGGGAEISEIPVNFTSPSSSGTYDVITVPVPEGKPHCVVYIINSAAISTVTTTYYPILYIDGESKGRVFGTGGGSVTSQSPVPIQIRRTTNNSWGDASHTGTVYYWPVD